MGIIVYGGKTDREDKYIQQTLVTNVTMQGKSLNAIATTATLCILSSKILLGPAYLFVAKLHCYFDLGHLPRNARCNVIQMIIVHLSFLFSC